MLCAEGARTNGREADAGCWAGAEGLVPVSVPGAARVARVRLLPGHLAEQSPLVRWVSAHWIVTGPEPRNAG
jgi:hypothetical protein